MILQRSFRDHQQIDLLLREIFIALDKDYAVIFLERTVAVSWYIIMLKTVLLHMLMIDNKAKNAV